MDLNCARVNFCTVFTFYFIAVIAGASFNPDDFDYKRNTRAAETTSPAQPSVKDPLAIVQQKCEEYSFARFQNVTRPGVIAGDNPFIIRELDCVQEFPQKAGVYAVKEKEYPHLALLGFGEKLEEANWTATGSLISERFILGTASHEKQANWAAVGLLNKNNIAADKLKKNIFKIIQTFIHPEYKAPSPYNDIALHKLEEAVTFTPSMRPACLYAFNEIPFAVQSKATITGWGKVEADELEKDAPKKGKVDFIEPSHCLKRYAEDQKLNHGFDLKSMICAGNIIGEDITCVAENGGPLQIPIPFEPCMWSLVGVSSYGSACGDDGTPSVYTKVSNYFAWIQNIVWP